MLASCGKKAKRKKNKKNCSKTLPRPPCVAREPCLERLTSRHTLGITLLVAEARVIEVRAQVWGGKRGVKKARPPVLASHGCSVCQSPECGSSHALLAAHIPVDFITQREISPNLAKTLRKSSSCHSRGRRAAHANGNGGAVRQTNKKQPIQQQSPQRRTSHTNQQRVPLDKCCFNLNTG